VRTAAGLDRGHRFPADVISQVIWLYFRFSVSYRDVEEMMAWRGVQLSYETVREGTVTLGGEQYVLGTLRARWPIGLASGGSCEGSRPADLVPNPESFATVCW
jgi:hypothetical protein